MSSKTSFFEKNEFIVPLGLFALFLAFTLPGIAWGAPSIWHPDEIVVRVIKALHGEWRFSEINFNYPDLPQYTMYYLGRLIFALGYAEYEVLIASRVLSAVVAGATVIFTYNIARRAGSSIPVAALSGLFLIAAAELSYNGRFAHNDTFTVFFTTLAVYFLVKYSQLNHRGWLYASFTAVGMAASSKYTGGALVLAPLAVFLFLQRKNFKRDWFSIGETLFISGALTFLGFSFGTPKALTWMSYFFKRVFTALEWQATWGQHDDSVRGLTGQFSLFQNTLGDALYIVFLLALIWGVVQVILSVRKPAQNESYHHQAIPILLFSIFVLDLPVMISYNYQPRYLLPMMPLLAVLAALFVGQVIAWTKQSNKPAFVYMGIGGISAIVLYSLLRLVSIALLFMNDARIPATEFMKTLPREASLETTNYPPSYPDGYFEREHNYPLYIIMGTTDAVPTDKPYEFNQAEQGLLDRNTDYLIVDSFTASRFNDPYVCEQLPNECEFFNKLAAGKTDHYQLIAEFNYELPWYLPQVSVAIANPTIRIYERIP